MADIAEGDAPSPEEIAAEVLGALDAARQIAPLSRRSPDFDVAAAYRVTAALRRMRERRGERHVGRKLGFTNRRLWAEYGVGAPIWGDLFAGTVHEIGAVTATIGLERHPEPKIEPEIAFGIDRAPEPGMDEAALMDCIGWVAHGIEIVQSIFPGWRISAADTVAGGAMHGCYLLGPRRAIAPQERTCWRRALESFSLTLLRDGEAVEQGHAGDVLDGPLTALRHLVALLADDPDNPPLAAGEFVTTGTVTRALDIHPGEHWQTRLDGLDLPALSVAFT